MEQVIKANVNDNAKKDYDRVITEIAEYVMHHHIQSTEAYATMKLCFLDALGCALLALQHPHCYHLLGPIIPGTVQEKGVPIPGTYHILDPMRAAFNLGTMIRWLDFNDTWLAKEWGHPSDNFGAIIATAITIAKNDPTSAFKLEDILTAAIKAYEIQGVLALSNSFNEVGLDHVVLVKVASVAVCTQLLGGDLEQIKAAISHAWVDGQALRTYRHAPNTGSRKSWAAGDACRRALEIAWLVLRGEKGIPTALTAPIWGFEAVAMHGKSLTLTRPLSSYVAENILFKINFPAEFHAQTAVECAVQLHPQVKNKWDAIEKIVLTTQEPAIRIISKVGTLNNYADRDHCLQYMVAIGLLRGTLTARDYSDVAAQDPLIDQLRALMVVEHEAQMTEDYYDSAKRAIGNAVQIYFKNGTVTEKIRVDYPIGHRQNRQKGLPLLLNKFKENLGEVCSVAQKDEILDKILNKNPREIDFLAFWNDFCEKTTIFC